VSVAVQARRITHIVWTSGPSARVLFDALLPQSPFPAGETRTDLALPASDHPRCQNRGDRPVQHPGSGSDDSGSTDTRTTGVGSF